MIKQFRHVIWDFNGTLFCDFELSFLILQDVLTEVRMPLIDRETYRLLFCHPLIEFYRKIGFNGDEETFHKVSKRWHEIYEARLGECGLHKMAKEMLVWCKECGFTQSILSALPDSILKSLVEKHSIGSFFSDIRGSSDFMAEGKIGIAKRWLAESDLAPKEIVLIGDTDHDAEVASVLGVSCVLLAQGFQARSVLEPCGFPVFDTMEEFYTALNCSDAMQR